MPSSAHSVSYSGPSCVYPQPLAAQSSMHNYYYKNPTPPGAVVPPTAQTNPSRTRLVLQETNSPAAGRFNSPVSARLNDGSRQAYSRPTSNNHSTQPNGQGDAMSASVHTPPRNPHFWSTTPSSTTHGATNSSTTTPLSSYAHNTVPTSNNTYGYGNSTGSPYCGVGAAANYDMGEKQQQQNGTGKPTANGSSKTPGLTSNRPLWKERPHVGRYSLIRTIGKGNFAKVKLAQHLTTGMQVAVKVIDKTLLNHSSMQKLFREVRVLKTLNHPNIIKLLEVIESERHLYLVTEYASGGEVFDYLVSHGKMKESQARAKFRQIVSAVQYCHQKMVVHRDLKAENLLLDEDLNVKIADFGFSNYFCPSKKLDTFCGSPPYAAPELFLGRKYDGPEVDVWSLGVILYTLVSGTLPFDGKNLKELRERVLRGTYRVPFYMTHECEMLLKKMLVLNPAKRLPLLEVMRDPWLNIGFESVLRPFSEPPTDYCDPFRIELMIRLGFQRHEIQDALSQQRFNNITATYILLSRYNPQVHGRLPGLGGQSSSTNINRSSKSSSETTRSRPDHDFVVNGTTQVLTPLTDTTTTTTTASSRPASATPATTSTHPLSGTPKLPGAGGSQRTSDETGKTGEQTRRDSSVQQTSSAAPRRRTSAGSVSSTVTASSSSTEGDAVSVPVKSEAKPERASNESGSVAVARPHGIRRSATTVEPRMLSTPYTKTATDLIAITPRVSLAATAATTTTLDPMVKPDSALTPPVLLHPTASPAVTTARLTLASGFTQPSAARLSSAPSPPHPTRSRSSSRCPTTTIAPLARLEDESTAAAVKSVASHELVVDPVATTVHNGSGRQPQPPSSSRTPSSSTSSEADSDSDDDVYDRECGSGSSDSSSTRTGKARPQAATTTTTSHTEPRITSVVVAAAPGINSSASSTNGAGGVTNNYSNAASDQLPESIHSKPPGEQSHFARLPSVRRRWTNRSSNEPTPTLASGPISARDQRVPPEGSTTEGRASSSLSSSSSAVTTNTIIKQSGPRTLVADPVNGDASSSKVSGSLTDRTGTTTLQPRGLFRGPPNVADILNEANPFRLTTELGGGGGTGRTLATTGAAITTPTNASNSSSRAYSPSPSTAGSSLPATRRPIAPPPLATTTTFSNYPSRTSYAYHSLRLPSSTTTATIAMGRSGRPLESSRGPQWLRDAAGDDDDDDGMATPTPIASAHATRDPYSVPFSRNLPERSTIQHVPTGRARERLESAPRLVRHPGTHSIANQSVGLRPRSPPYLTADVATPRPASPDDDLSISSANSSVSTLSQLAAGARKDFTAEDVTRPGSMSARQSHTLDSPGLRANRQQSARAMGNRDGQTNGGLNNFFRSITTRISRSKLFRRSAILQPNEPNNLTQQPMDQRIRLDAMTAPTMDLDKVILTHGSSSPNGATNTTSGSHSARLPRSRSGVTPHRPVSQVATPRQQQQAEPSDRIPDSHHSTFRRTPSRKEVVVGVREPSTDSRALEGTLEHKWSKRRSTSSHDTRRRSSSSKRPPDESPSPEMDQQRGGDEDDPTEEPATLGRSKSRRSMRYVLKPFAKWPLDEVMIEVKRTLTNHGVDFELIGERKLQCVYGDPSSYVGRQSTASSGPRDSKRMGNSNPAGLLDGVVHWEMEVGKLAGVGVNGIRFKRINGSMATFKQIAKKLAADLRF